MRVTLAFLALGWACTAQESTPSPGEVQAIVLRDLRGTEHNGADLNKPMPPQRLEHRWEESISIEQMRHKIPKTARKNAEHAAHWSRAGNHARAVPLLESAITEDPDFVQAYNALGIEYARENRLGEAAKMFRRVTELLPELWVGHYNLGLALFRSGDLEGAVQSERRALRLAPSQPSVNGFLDSLQMNGSEWTTR